MHQVPGESDGLPKPPQVGDLVAGRYRICKLLGAGGFGVVYHARQESIGRDVAIKFLQPNISRDPVAIERFRREAFFASTLRHPNTITIHDYGATDDGLFYLVMEFLEGESLARAVFKSGGLTVGRALRIGAQILKSLGEAHQKGLVHRDLKPENIFLTEVLGESDFVQVLDFGLSKALAGGQAAAGNNDMTLTQEGMVFGTPLYMAPEQAYGEEVVPASDVFAFGLLLYEMLVGRRPFQGFNHIEILRKMTSEPLPRLPAPLDTSPLQGYLDHLTEKDLRRRYANGGEALPPLVALMSGELAAVCGDLDEIWVGTGKRPASLKPKAQDTPPTPARGVPVVPPRGTAARPAPVRHGQRPPPVPPAPGPPPGPPPPLPGAEPANDGGDTLFAPEELAASAGPLPAHYERPKQDPRRQVQRKTLFKREMPVGDPPPPPQPPPSKAPLGRETVAEGHGVPAPPLPAGPSRPPEGTAPRRHMGFGAEAPTVIASLNQVWQDIPLIGRDAELARLLEAVDRLGRGAGGMIMVVADAGLGKTRLVVEMRRVLVGRGVRVVQGDYLGPMGGAGMGLRRALAELVGLVDCEERDAGAVLARHLEGLGLYSPERHQTLMALIRPQALGSEERWSSLSAATPATYQVLGELLMRETRRQPLVLILEDLHWADPFAAGFAEYLAQALGDEAQIPLAQGTRSVPLLIVGTLRREAMLQNPDLVNAYHRMGRHLGLGFERLDLSRLNERDVRRLIQHVIEPAEATQREIIRLSGGNPMYILQAMRYLSAQTMARFQQRGTPTQEALPPTMSALVQARTQQLTGRTRQGTAEVLNLSSLLGLRFPYKLLEDYLVYLGRDDLIEGLERVLADIAPEGFLSAEPGSRERFYCFDHSLIQEALLEGLARHPDYRRFHEAAARAKEQTALREAPTLSTMASLADVAHHWREAGDRARMFEVMMRQGQTAEQGLDLKSAQRIFAQLDEEVGRDGALTRLQVEAKLALGRLQIKLGESGPAEDQLRQASDLAARLGDSGLEGRSNVMLGKVLTWQSRYREALRCFRRAVSSYTNLKNTTRVDLAGLADAQLGQAEIARVRGDLDTAETELRRAWQKASQAQAHEVEAHCLQALGRVDHVRGRLKEAMDNFSAARRLFDDAGLLIESANVATDLALVQLYVHGRDVAEQTILDALDTLRMAGDQLAVANAEIHLGIILRRGEDLARAQRVVDVALATFQRLQHQYGIAKALLLRGEIAFMRGGVEEAIADGRDALKIHEAIADAHGTALCLIYLGHWAMEQGRLDQAEAQIVHALDILQGGGILLYRAQCQALLGRLAELRGDVKGAERKFSTAYNEARNSNNREVLAYAAASLGGHAFACGRLNEARGYFHNSLTLAHEIDLVDCRVRALFNLAWLSALGGKTVEQAELLGRLREERARGFNADVHLREHAAQLSKTVAVVRGAGEAQRFRRAALEILQKLS